MKLPKIIPLEQRSEAWHAWRAGKDIDGPRITATDIPVIMGVSKFATPYELWLKKTGRAEPQPLNWAMRRGIHFEPYARRIAERLHGHPYEDVCVEHPDIPWAAASLDGLSPLFDDVLEIKVPGEEAHALAILGEVPVGYFPQVQWQLMCTPSAERAFYLSFAPPDEAALRADPMAEGQAILVELAPDPAYQDTALKAAESFRQCLIDDVPPCGEEFLALAAAYDQLREQNREVEARLEWLEARMKSHVNVVDRQVQGGGITVTQSIRKGLINLKDYLKSKSIVIDWAEAEGFRAPSSSSVTLTYKPGVAVPILRKALQLEAATDGADTAVALGADDRSAETWPRLAVTQATVDAQRAHEELSAAVLI